MPFTWLSTVPVGDVTLAGCTSHGTPQPPVPYGLGGKDIQEIRDNADWLKDNIVCQLHNSGDYGPHNDNYDASDRATHNASANLSEDAIHNATYQATNKSSDKATANSAEDATHNTTVKASDDKAAHIDCPGHNYGYEGSQNQNYFGGNDAVVYGTNNGGYNAVDLLSNFIKDFAGDFAKI